MSSKNKQQKKQRRRRLIADILAAFMLLGLFGVYAVSHHNHHTKRQRSRSFSQLIHNVDSGRVTKLTLNPNVLTVQVTAKHKVTYTVGVPGQSGEQLLLAAADKHDVPESSLPLPLYATSRLLAFLQQFGPSLIMLLLLGALYWKYRPAAKFKASPKTDVTFDQVAGCGEVVEELADVREFLKDPSRFRALGARVPKGVLLYGPPGTGKTLLAKAIANEAGVPFYPVVGSDFVEMFAGLGANRVRALFKEAKSNAPSIIFIDEVDSVGRERSSGGSGADREADQTLTQLLTEMDGFSVNDNPVIVIAATNHMELIDGALLRPGRFDRRVSVDAPDKAGRLDVLRLHASDKQFDSTVDLDELATHTAGMTGAELANILNETVLQAARRHANAASAEDLDEAFHRVLSGVRKQNRALTDHERRVVACHEAGHAIVGELLEAAEKVHKISIIPRGRSAGQTILIGDEDVMLHGRKDLQDRIAWMLGGRAAEQVVFGDVTSGAADDLQRASDLVNRMLTELGMGESLGLRAVTRDTHLSPTAQRALDEEAKDLLECQFEAATRIIVERADALNAVTEALLQHETLGREQFLELLEAHNA